MLWGVPRRDDGCPGADGSLEVRPAGAHPEHGTRVAERKAQSWCETDHHKALQRNPNYYKSSKHQKGSEGWREEGRLAGDQGEHGREGITSLGAKEAWNDTGDGHRHKQNESCAFGHRSKTGSCWLHGERAEWKDPTPARCHRPGHGAESGGHSGRGAHLIPTGAVRRPWKRSKLASCRQRPGGKQTPTRERAV